MKRTPRARRVIALGLSIAVGVLVGWVVPARPALVTAPAAAFAETGDATRVDVDAIVGELAAQARFDAWVAEVEAARAGAELERQAAQVGVWSALHRCEQDGDWHAYGRFGNGAMGGGGLGISDGAWVDSGGREYAATAAGASPYEQTVIAARIRDRFGRGAWDGCSWAVP